MYKQRHISFNFGLVILYSSASVSTEILLNNWFVLKKFKYLIFLYPLRNLIFAYTLQTY